MTDDDSRRGRHRGRQQLLAEWFDLLARSAPHHRPSELLASTTPAVYCALQRALSSPPPVELAEVPDATLALRHALLLLSHSYPANGHATRFGQLSTEPKPKPEPCDTRIQT